MAERLAGRWPFRRLCGPALVDMRDDPGPLARHADVGAIAGTFGPPGLPLARPHDGAVSVRSAWAGANQRVTVPVLHTTLPASLKVMRLTARFLETGRFG